MTGDHLKSAPASPATRTRRNRPGRGLRTEPLEYHPMSDLAIDITNASKTYKGKIHALRGVDLRVGRGEVFGLLGPNGAGKSTLVKILMTVIRPSTVNGTVLGKPVTDKSTLARVGYLPEHHRFPDYLKGWQVLDFYGGMAGIPRKARKHRTDQLLELVGMRDWAKKRIKQYSKGMRQRIGIAQALMNNPDLILLDEPTDGVDPKGRRDIREICQQLKDEGRTVFINSHLLSELELVCDRVAIMVQGLVAQQGTIDELTEGQEHYRIELAGDPEKLETAMRAALPSAGLIKQLPAAASTHSHAPRDGSLAPRDASLARVAAARGQLATGEWLELNRNTLRIGTADPEAVRPIVKALIDAGHTIQSLTRSRPSLEDLFMAAIENPDTGESLGPGAIRNANKRPPPHSRSDTRDDSPRSRPDGRDSARSRPDGRDSGGDA